VRRKILFILLFLIILIGGLLIRQLWPKRNITNAEWHTYANKERGYEMRYPKSAKIEDLGYDLLGSIKISFDDDCYLGLDGGPFGFGNGSSPKPKNWQDMVLIGETQHERHFTEFQGDGSGFANISLPYPQNSNYPYFLIYHSTKESCLSTINQILSTFKFID